MIQTNGLKGGQQAKYLEENKEAIIECVKKANFWVTVDEFKTTPIALRGHLNEWGFAETFGLLDVPSPVPKWRNLEAALEKKVAELEAKVVAQQAELTEMKRVKVIARELKTGVSLTFRFGRNGRVK